MNRLLAIVIAAVALAGCGDESPDQQLASAKAYLQKKDLKAAVIQIKNVLQKNPDSGEARFLLGSTLLKQREVVAAEVELRKALAAKHPKEEVVPELARAMLMLGQAKKAVDEFGGMHLTKPAAEADLQTSLAAAYTALGNRDAARAAADAALAADGTYVPARLFSARQKASNRDFDGALAIVDAVTQADPASAEGWTLRGDILFYGKGDSDAALEAYKKAVTADPEAVAAQVAVATVLMRKGRLDEASRQVEQIKKLAPKDPATKYLEATLAFQKKEFNAARELIQPLLQIAPGDPRVLHLAGAVEHQIGSPLQAEVYLTRATQIAPGLIGARRLLIEIYLRTGQTAKALAALKSMDEKRDFDAATYALAGEVYLQNGDAKQAEQAFAQSLKLDPTDARKRTALAVTQLAGGQVDAGLDALQDIAGVDTGVTADLALISAHLRRNEFDKALAAVDRLEKKRPGKPLAANLRGQILVLRNDPVGARRSFERALSIDPKFFPAVASLAALDVTEKRPEDAKKRFEAVLARDPKSVQALLSLARLAASNDSNKDEVIDWLTKAIDVAPTNPAPRLLLIDAYLRNGDSKEALDAAQSGVAAMPDSPEMLSALGRVQQVSGDVNQAIASYGKVVALQPLSPVPLLRLSEAQLAGRDFKAAEQSLRKALDLKVDYLEAQRALVVVLLNERDYNGAVEVARTVQNQRPKEAIGMVLEGDIAAARKDWPAAVLAYKRGLRLAKAPGIAVKLHSATLDGGNAKEAEQFAQSWLSANPKDAIFLLYLSTSAIQRKDYATAESQLKSLLQVQPNSALVLNNLAWVSFRLKRDDAIGYAQRAVELAPNQPEFSDTLATILSARGEHAQAIKLQVKALALQPTNTKLRLSLAKIYIAAGDKSKARKELETLARMGSKAIDQAEVDALLKKL